MFENFHKVSSSYDPEKVEWRNYKDLNNKDFKIDFDFCLLGFDIQNGRLDMLLRYPEGKVIAEGIDICLYVNFSFRR